MVGDWATPHLIDWLRTGLVPPVELRETHGSWVLLDQERALKIRKPVRYSFMDYSTIERRYAAAVAEIRLNASLAPGVYLAVRPLLAQDGHYALGPPGWSEDAVDYAVEMRRFDERRTMAALARDGRLRAEQIDEVATVLARFHADAERCDGGAEDFLVRVHADIRDIEQLALNHPILSTGAWWRFAEAAVARHAAQLDERAHRGLWRDGHGDLRAEHVVCEQPLAIVDRIEFDAGLRRGDVAGDLAYLAMDLEALGQRWAAERLYDAYARAGGDPGDPGLRALFAWQRALVGAKVALLRGDEARLGTLIDLADRLAWRERMPRVLLVLGPPACGKSTLAAALASRSGLRVLGSDELRKTMQGVDPAQRLPAEAYRDEVTTAVYRELARRAAAVAAIDGGAIVDASGRSRALRAILSEQLDGSGPLVAAICTAPTAVRQARADVRLADPRRVSDADPAIVAAAQFEPIDAEPGIDRVLVVHTDQPVQAALEELAAQLDAVPSAAAC